MSEFVAARSKALDQVAKDLRRIRRMAQPAYSELDVWRDMAATFQRDLPDCTGSDMEVVMRVSLDICDRRIQSLEGFARDGARETYS